MAGKRTKRRRIRGGQVVLAAALTLLLSAAVIGGVWLWRENQPGPADLRESRAGTVTTLSLYQAPETAADSAPVPAAAPDVTADEEESPFEIVEILGEETDLTVARILGKRYKGFVALVRDPSRLYVGTIPYYGENVRGRTVNQMADDNGAILAINGGAFADPNGEGWGGMPQGNGIVNGEVRYGGGGSTVGMDAQGKLYAGEFTSGRCRELGLVWALSYGPTLIENGEIRPNLANNLSEPRTAVGQLADGTVVLLNIQGRQVSALGVTYQQLAEIMLRFGCVTAGNLDGGASSDMYYRGEFVNISNTSGGPRPLPTALLLAPAAGEEG